MEPGMLAPAADRPAHAELTRQNIIWLASYPKSGNTWVRVFVHNLLNELSGVAEAQDINRMDTHTLWEFAAKPFERVLGKSMAAADQAEVAAARPEVQRQLANGRSEPVLVKTHLCIGNEYQHSTINLNATLAAIYIVRNPLDVAISYAHHSGVRIDAMIASMATPGLKTPETAQAAYQVLGSWSQNVASWLGLADRPMHIMRYEDLVANPVRPFGTLARFLGLTPTEQQLRAAIAKSSFGELRRQESENGFVERPRTAKVFFREGRAGQWRDVLSPAQIQEITRAHAPMMQRFGYLAPDCGRPLLRKQAV